MDFFASTEFASLMILNDIGYTRKIISVSKGWAKALRYKCDHYKCDHYKCDPYVEAFVNDICILKVDLNQLFEICIHSGWYGHNWFQELDQSKMNILVNIAAVPAPVTDIYFNNIVKDLIKQKRGIFNIIPVTIFQ